MAEAGGPESAAARCLDESSDSEPEQEPGSPQKLIRKVSTSGQIRSKVSRVPERAGISGSAAGSVCSFSGGGPHTAGGTASCSGQRAELRAESSGSKFAPWMFDENMKLTADM